MISPLDWWHKCCAIAFDVMRLPILIRRVVLLQVSSTLALQGTLPQRVIDGAWRSRVGTIMAAKHEVNIGNSNVKLAVISATRTIPVTGARTTAVKNVAIPTTATAVGWGARLGTQRLQRVPKKKPL